MLHEERKLSKIVDELTVYFLAVGADSIESGIEIADRQAIIRFRANYRPEYEGRFQCMEKYLNGEKNDGMEGIYWELAGSGDPGESSQLLLVGMMTDRAEIEMKDGFVNLILYKKLQ